MVRTAKAALPITKFATYLGTSHEVLHNVLTTDRGYRTRVESASMRRSGRSPAGAPQPERAGRLACLSQQPPPVLFAPK